MTEVCSVVLGKGNGRKNPRREGFIQCFQGSNTAQPEQAECILPAAVPVNVPAGLFEYQFVGFDYSYAAGTAGYILHADQAAGMDCTAEEGYFFMDNAVIKP